MVRPSSLTFERLNPEHKNLSKVLRVFFDGASLCTAVWYAWKTRHFESERESDSSVTSNLCAGSIGRFVSGSIGRLTLEYSARWTSLDKSNTVLLRRFSSFVWGHNLAAFLM